MTKKVLLSAVAVLCMAGSLLAHDMYLKLATYFLPANTSVTVSLINGTFDKSENAIARDRMLDVSVVGPEAQTMHPKDAQWRDEDNAALLDFKTGGPGTYVLGVSTAARTFTLSADDFNEYLAHDGVVDMLAKRKKDGSFGKEARERYSKHVKAIVQVGDAQTGSYDHVLGYPIEIVPIQNPYALGVGDDLQVRVLRDGKPVANQIVYASHEGHHGHDAEGNHQEAVTTRTDAKGVASISLSEAGRWYIRLIHMVETTDDETDYESNWATLTFQVR